MHTTKKSLLTVLLVLSLVYAGGCPPHSVNGILLYFYKDNCTVCDQQDPEIDKIDNHFTNLQVMKLNIDELEISEELLEGLAGAYNVSEVPAMAYLKPDDCTMIKVGYSTYSELKDWICSDECLEIEEEILCNDSDNGITYYEKGTVIGINGALLNGFTSFTDKCEADLLSEYYCTDNLHYPYTNVFGVVEYECPNGCEDGACVEEEPKDIEPTNITAEYLNSTHLLLLPTVGHYGLEINDEFFFEINIYNISKIENCSKKTTYLGENNFVNLNCTINALVGYTYEFEVIIDSENEIEEENEDNNVLIKNITIEEYDNGEPECSLDSDCADCEYCVNSTCVEIPSGECGYIENHTWFDYECCEDSDCGGGFVCTENACVEVLPIIHSSTGGNPSKSSVDIDTLLESTDQVESIKRAGGFTELICPNNVVVTITSEGSPIEGVAVILIGLDVFYNKGPEETDEEGKAYFAIQESGSYRIFTGSTPDQYSSEKNIEFELGSCEYEEEYDECTDGSCSEETETEYNCLKDPNCVRDSI